MAIYQSELIPGDVVRLKSGGPVLTITSSDRTNPDRFNVAWFEGYELRTASVYAVALEPSARNTSVAFIG